MAENTGAENVAYFSAYKSRGHDLGNLRRRRVEASFETPSESNALTETMTLPEIISGMNSSDPSLVLMATESVRKILCTEKYPPVKQIVEAGLVELLVTFLGYNDRPDLQYEAAWVLTNIASGSTRETHTIVSAGAVPQLIRLLESPVIILVEQCVWALGNIAGDGATMRDLITKSGIIEPLLRLVDMNAPPSFLCNVIWTIANLCRNRKPPPKMTAIKACLPALKSLIHHPDNGVLVDACWALAYITAGTNDQIQVVVEFPGAVARFVELLGSSEPAVVTPALRALGHIVTGNKFQTQAVIKNNMLKMMPGLLQHYKKAIKKEACWVLSNITAGSTEQIQVVINLRLVPLLVEILTKGDFRSQKEATWVICNMALGGTLEQVRYAVQCGVLKPLCDKLTTRDTKLVCVLLDGICRTLESANRAGRMESLCVQLDEAGGLDKIEQLQNHKNIEVYNRAFEIISKYFSDDVENELSPDSNDGDNQCRLSASGVRSAQDYLF